MSSCATLVNDYENGDGIQLPSSTAAVPVAPSNTTTTRATGRHQGNRKRSRGRTSLATADAQPGISSETDNEEPGISSETADREDARVTEDDLTPAERPISAKRLLRGLGQHPSMYARAGQNPPTQGLSFRGAWKRAVELYRAANDHYKRLFANAGFGDFLKIDPVELPQGYLIALTERWFHETNTVHLPCGEIGPTPVDWTMITGLRFGGEPIHLDPNYKKAEVLGLLRIKDLKKNFSGIRIRMSAIKPKKEEVELEPETREEEEITFRRLFLYVIGSCFFGNNQSAIHPKLVKLLEDIHAVGSYDWGASTYAAFLTGMRRKVKGEIGSFIAFWQFLPFWAFEYLNICRPEHAQDVDVFPRAMRWKFPQNHGTVDNSELTASRCQLDYVDDESKVTWQPYLDTEKYRSGDINSSITLAKSRVPFMGFETWEYYLGERCRRQLGFPCRVPSDPPENMHGEWKNDPKNDPESDPRSDPESDPRSDPESDPASDPANNPASIENSAETLVESENLEYASWFAYNSIGKIVDVYQLIGGSDIGRKVINDWTAKHRRGMILVRESEVKEITLARDAADAERKKLQEELSQVRRG